MSSKNRIAVALLVYLTAQSAWAADRPEPSLSWRLAFGAGQVQTGYGLTLAYRAGDLDGAALRVLELDVSDRAAVARLAGVPLVQRDYRASQDDAATAPEFRVALSEPWYTKQWVWWTVGGVAATAALAGGGSELTIDYNETNGNSPRSDGCNGTSGNIGPQEIPCSDDAAPDTGDQCVGDACVTCDDSVITVGSDCGGSWTARREAVQPTRDIERQQWLDAGTGHMGDLFRR